MKKLFNRNMKWIANLRVKSFALLSAFLLWFYVLTGQEHVSIFNVPLEIINPPEQYVLLEPIPSEVAVRFRGTGRGLFNLALRKKSLVLDVENSRNPRLFILGTDMVEGIASDSDVIPQEIADKDSIWIYWDEYIEHEVPVRSQLVLNTMPGYIQVGTVSFSPDSVKVCGPREKVNRISEVITQEKIFNNLLKDLEGRISLQKVGSEQVALLPDYVEFLVDIQSIGERIISEIPVQVINVPRYIKEVRVIPSTMSLTLHGGNELLAKLTRDHITVTIDYSKWAGSGEKVNARITFPEDLMYSHAVPTYFDLVPER